MLFGRVLKADAGRHPAASDAASSAHGQERGSGVQRCHVNRPDTTARRDSPHSLTHNF